VELCWRASRWVTVSLGLCALLASLAGPLAAVAMRALFDALTTGGSWGGPAIGVAAATGGLGVLGSVQDFLRSELTRRVSVRVPDQLFAALERLTTLAWFDDPRSHDRLQLAQQAGNQVSSLLLTGGLGLAQSVVSVAGFVLVLSGISWPVTLGLLAAVLPALVAQLALARARAKVTRDVSHSERRRLFFQMLLSDYTAIREIRLFGAGRYLRGRMTTELTSVAARERVLSVRLLRVEWLLALLSAAVLAGAIAFAAQGVAAGRLGVGDLSAVLAAAAGIGAAAGVLVGQLSQTSAGLLLFDSYLDVARLAPDAPVSVVALPPLRDGITFHYVWFRYPDSDEWALRGLTLTLRRGESTALVGLNGAGKSTLVLLLCRLYDPTRGRISWDAVDLRDADPAALRARLSVVFQDFMRYDLTALENVALRADADLAAVRAAAVRAGIDEAISRLPAGYDTPLTRIFADEQDAPGVRLSGGQWQRLAIARALLREDADVLVVDEPTSGLDPRAERRLREELLRQRRGRTGVMVSHRLGGLRETDRIVVLEDGAVAEDGTHDELLARGGRYAELFELQAADYRDPPPAGDAPGPSLSTATPSTSPAGIAPH
jgi:ATP-binding cassette subfamily B protein